MEFDFITVLREEGLPENLLQTCIDESIISFEDFKRLSDQDIKDLGFKLGQKNQLKAIIEHIENDKEEEYEYQPQNIYTEEVKEIDSLVQKKNDDLEFAHETEGDLLYNDTKEKEEVEFKEKKKQEQRAIALTYQAASNANKACNTIALTGNIIRGLDETAAGVTYFGRALKKYKYIRNLGVPLKTGSSLSAIGSNTVALAKNQACSKLNWTLAAVAFAVESGCHLTMYFQGKITGKMLAKRIAISAISGTAGVFIGVGFMAIGASIGTAICPALGTAIGAIIGGIAGAVASYFATKQVEKYVDSVVDTTKDEEYLHQKMMYQNSLQVFSAINATDKTPLDEINKEKNVGLPSS